MENEGRVGHTRVPRRVDVRYDALSRAYRHRSNPRTQREGERERERERNRRSRRNFTARQSTRYEKIITSSVSDVSAREVLGTGGEWKGREKERGEERERWRVWSGVFLPQEEAAEGVEEEEEARNRAA